MFYNYVKLVQLIYYLLCPHLYLTTNNAKGYLSVFVFFTFLKQTFSVTLCIADIEHVLQFVMLYLLTMSHNSGSSMCTAQ